jgi:hypothetical protein
MKEKVDNYLPLSYQEQGNENIVRLTPIDEERERARLSEDLLSSSDLLVSPSDMPPPGSPDRQPTSWWRAARRSGAWGGSIWDPPVVYAARYAAAGRVIFPQKPCTKLPYGEISKDRHYLQEPYIGSSDLDQISAWWREWPAANIGCALGRSHLIVIDMDNKHPDVLQPGWVTIRDLEEKYGEELPPTTLVRTPSSGLHAYFSLGGAEPVIKPSFLENVDVPAQVPLPPSCNSTPRPTMTRTVTQLTGGCRRTTMISARSWSDRSP